MRPRSRGCFGVDVLVYSTAFNLLPTGSSPPSGREVTQCSDVARYFHVSNPFMIRMLNFLLYQAGWFACVLGAAASRPWWGIVIASCLVGVHLYLTTDRLNQVKIMAIAIAVGLVVDSMLLLLGVYSFPIGTIVAWLPPLWMTVLWPQFATTFRYCLRWLSKRYVMCACFGFFGAPMAFLGGEQLGAVAFLPPRFTNLLLLGVLWSAAIPLLIYASDRIHARATAEASYRGLDRSS